MCSFSVTNEVNLFGAISKEHRKSRFWRSQGKLESIALHCRFQFALLDEILFEKVGGHDD
jgi:hypothetical protein